MKTRKQNLLHRISVKWIGTGTYRWTLQYRGNEIQYDSHDSMIYDVWKSDEITQDELEHIAKLCRRYGTKR
jgi:hypothetical protein